MKLSRAVICIILAVTFTGCSNIKNKYATIPLVPALSEKEVIDYYKESLNYENVVSRNLSVKTGGYELKDVSEDTKTQLMELQNIIESELNSNAYIEGSNISKEQYEYIKCIVDDKILYKKAIAKLSEAVDLYFVDVEYSTKAQEAGKFKSDAQYLGIHGAFERLLDGTSRVNRDLLSKAEWMISDYESKNTIDTETKADEEVDNATAENMDTLVTPEDNTIPLVDNTVATVDDTVDNTNYTENISTETNNEAETTREIGREPVIDIEVYNNIVGSSLTQTSNMPQLDLVYEPSTAKGNISGYGIFPHGERAAAELKYNRASSEGTVVLRYIFMNSTTEFGKIDFVDIYMMNLDVNTNTLEDNTNIIPEFVGEELKKVLERSDRAINNNDISALMSGKIYKDIGVAVLNGHFQNNVHLTRKISNLNKILDRQDNTYIAEVESLTQEGIRGIGSQGTYKDTYIMVFKQEGVNFIIYDYIWVKRETIKEPSIKLDDITKKRLICLGLRGEVPEESKQQIVELLHGLYTASTNRELKGMYNSFESDENLLLSSKKEYLNSQLRQWLTKKGVNNVAIYTGRPVEWLGGTGKQAELITEELIDYEGQNIGQYMRTYYLVSNLSGQWAIQEMKTIELRDVTEDELTQIKIRIAQ